MGISSIIPIKACKKLSIALKISITFRFYPFLQSGNKFTEKIKYGTFLLI